MARTALKMIATVNCVCDNFSTFFFCLLFAVYRKVPTVRVHALLGALYVENFNY